MPGLTKKQFLAIQNVVRRRMDTVKLGQLWSHLHNEWNIGVIHGKNLKLNTADRAKLRDCVIAELGIDPMEKDIGGDRIEMASSVINEKWSSKNVFEDYVSIIATATGIPLKRAKITVPTGAILSIPHQDIDTASVNQIIIIENGSIATHWQSFLPLIPDSLHDSLVLYRGHDSTSSGLKKLLKSLPSNVEKIGFFDLDPAGMNIAMQMGVDKILVPVDPDALKNKSNRECFMKQHNMSIGKTEDVPGGWKETWVWIIENGISITQEAMLATNSSLKVINKAL